MELSGSIQAKTVLNVSGDCQGVQIHYDQDGFAKVSRRSDLHELVKIMTVEILRIKEGPHGTDAE